MKRSAWGAKGLLAFFILFSFLTGALSLGLDRPAEAKTKKIVRKVKHKKKLVRKVKAKNKKKLRRSVKSKKKTVKAPKKAAAAKKAVPANQAADYDLPSVGGTVTQTYAVEEGIGEPEVENLVNTLKGIGAFDAYADTSRNTMTVKFNSSKVTSAAIIKKLKTLGYTAKRQK